MNETFRKKWLPIFGLFFGLFIIGYYPVTELIDSLRRQQVIDNLEQTVYETDDSKREEILAQARAWNRLIAGKDPGKPADDILPYERQITADGADTSIGYVVIPSLSLSMPIYHGTGNAALSAGCGHLDYTSLPVGENNTHTAITAHSGMANMRAFDDIRDLEPGDVIGISVLGTMRCYRVTESETVLPTEVESLDIQPGRDLCTLITCTPYGINTHRLLVHATRCPVPPGFGQERITIRKAATNRRIWPFLVALTFVITVLIIAWLRFRQSRKESERDKEGAGHSGENGSYMS